jgi:hypothetical protein
MFKSVLKSLSDTELVAIASEVINPNIPTKSIVAQLNSKLNSPVQFSGKTSKEMDLYLVSEVIKELSSRLLEDRV